MLTEIFKSILLTSLIGSGTTLTLAFLKPITKRLFGHGWHYYIWLAVLIVMILPVRFSFPDTSRITHQIEPAITIQTETINRISPPNYNQITYPAPSVVEQSPVKPISAFADFIETFTLIWFLGVLAALFLCLIGYFRLLFRIYKNSVVISCHEIRKYTKRNITVRIYKGLSSPFIIGIFRPSLILPDTCLTDCQLDNILLHETTHLRRNDILYKWLCVFVKALHWFNPAVYYVANQINTECEISCDMAVVKSMNNLQTADYIDTIISLLSAGKSKSIPLTTGMTGNKNTLKKRFKTIKDGFFVNKKIMFISIISAILIFALAIAISGFLGGKWINLPDNTITELNTDNRNGDIFNTLIVGVDEKSHADAIMLLKVEETGIEGFSIPRNAVLDDKTASQILAQENGDQKMIDAIRDKFKLPITYYAKIKIDLIRDLVDTVGGITVDVPMDMKYDDPHKNLHIDLKKGDSQTLNGDQICDLLQFRRSNDGTGYTEGDLDRIKIGQQVLSAFLSQNKLNKLAINSRSIIDSINKNVTTNYPIKIFVKDRKLLSGKSITFYTVPGKTAADDEGLKYKVNSAQLNDMLSYSAPPDNNLPTINSQINSSNAVNSSAKGTTIKEVESTKIPTPDTKNRYTFSSIAEAEQYLQSDGAVIANDNSFKSGSNYIKDGYSFENSSNETISYILSNNNGEVYMYFNGNINSLMEVSFKDTETRDEVNSAVILTGHSRIYKFTGLDPTRHYDIELTDKNDSEWDINGQYLIF